MAAERKSDDMAGAEAGRRRGRLGRWAANAAVFFAGLAVALVAVEIVLRTVFYFPQPQFLQIDDFLGHRLRPGVSGYYVEEGFSKYSINSYGFRDREYAFEKPPGVFRIAVLGDSYVEALQVGLEQTFPKLLEKRLKKAQVLSFGVSGYGTAQELLAYRRYARRFSPDLVILVFYAGNDISDNSKEISHGYPRPYFLLENGKLVLDTSFRQSRRHRSLRRWGPIYYFLTDHLALAQCLDKWRRDAMRRRRARRIVEERKKAERPIEPGLSRGIFGPPQTPELRRAWTLTEHLILELDREVRDDGATLTLVTVTMAAQTDPALRARIEREHPDWDLDYPDRRVRKFAEEHGIPCLNLGPGFMDYNRRTGKVLHGFGGEPKGHWNAEGHRLAAELIYRFLVRRGLVPKDHIGGDGGNDRGAGAARRGKRRLTPSGPSE